MMGGVLIGLGGENYLYCKGGGRARICVMCCVMGG